MGGASLAVLFEGSAKRCFHTTLKLGDQGCLTVLTRVQIGWLFFFEEPGIIYIEVDLVYSQRRFCHWETIKLVVLLRKKISQPPPGHGREADGYAVFELGSTKVPWMSCWKPGGFVDFGFDFLLELATFTAEGCMWNIF